jgi:hypothetical protein
VKSEVLFPLLDDPVNNIVFKDSQVLEFRDLKVIEKESK